MTFTYREIWGATDPAFLPLADLYVETFPADERESLVGLARWIQPVDLQSEAADSRGHMIGAFLDEEPIAFLYFGYFKTGYGFYVYVAVRPELETDQGRISLRQRGVARELFRRAEVACRQDAHECGSIFAGWIGEVERVVDAVDEADRAKREQRLLFFRNLKTRCLTPEYTQPSLGEGKEPVPLNLMFGEADGGISDSDLVKAVYREVFELDEDDPLVQRALAGVGQPGPL